jgi:soluble lytic murein transglycosylase
VKKSQQRVLLFILLVLIPAFLHPESPASVLATSQTPDQKWEKALEFYKKKEYQHALPILRELEENERQVPFHADALFMQAQALRALQRWPEAAQVFSRAGAVHPKLADYALYYQGEAWQKAKEDKKSLEVYQDLVNRHPDSLRVPQARLKMAEIYLERREYFRCVEMCEHILKEKTRKEVVAQAMVYMGEAQEGLGEWARAIESYQEAWLQYPLLPLAKNLKSRWESLAKNKKLPVRKIPPAALLRRALFFYDARLYESAWKELKKIEEFPLKKYPPAYAGESWIDELYLHRGLCLFYLKKYAQAIEPFRLVAAHSRNEALAERSLFWSMRSLYRWGRKEEALQTFPLFRKRYPQGSFMDQALHLQAQILEEQEKVAQALALYRELAASFPRSSLRFQAAWQAGWLLFRNQDLPGAIRAWDSLQALNPSSPWAEKALYWKGKALRAMEQIPLADAEYQKLVQNFPVSYYSQLASSPGESFLTTKGFSTPLNDRPFGTFIRGKEPLPENEIGHLEKSKNLARLGLFPQAIEELGAAEEEGKTVEGVLKEIARLYREAGEYHRSALLVRRNFNLRLLTGDSLRKDQDLYLLAYPLGDSSWVNPYARNRNLDPALLSAVILEESRFHPQALSVSGARGLMQVIPPTGKQIARTVKLHPFSNELLFEPEINLRLGSWYLAHLLGEFGGRETLAVAAYNAGPGAVREWIKGKNSLQEDEFLENIPYQETRHYVIRVLTSARVYRLLYGSTS